MSGLTVGAKSRVSGREQQIPQSDIQLSFQEASQSDNPKIFKKIAATHIWPKPCNNYGLYGYSRGPESKRQKRQCQIIGSKLDPMVGRWSVSLGEVAAESHGVQFKPGDR